MNSPVSDLTRQEKRDSKSQNLDSRYASIGFPAVAAAAHYPSDSRNSDSPKARRLDSEDQA